MGTTDTGKRKSKVEGKPAPGAKVLPFVLVDEVAQWRTAFFGADNAVRQAIATKKPEDVSAARTKLDIAFAAEVDHLMNWHGANLDDPRERCNYGKQLTINEYCRSQLADLDRSLRELEPEPAVVLAEVIDLAVVRRAVARSKRRDAKGGGK